MEDIVRFLEGEMSDWGELKLINLLYNSVKYLGSFHLTEIIKGNNSLYEWLIYKDNHFYSDLSLYSSSTYKGITPLVLFMVDTEVGLENYIQLFNPYMEDHFIKQLIFIRNYANLIKEGKVIPSKKFYEVLKKIIELGSKIDFRHREFATYFVKSLLYVYDINDTYKTPLISLFPEKQKSFYIIYHLMKKENVPEHVLKYWANILIQIYKNSIKSVPHLYYLPLMNEIKEIKDSPFVKIFWQEYERILTRYSSYDEKQYINFFKKILKVIWRRRYSVKNMEILKIIKRMIEEGQDNYRYYVYTYDGQPKEEYVHKITTNNLHFSKINFQSITKEELVLYTHLLGHGYKVYDNIWISPIVKDIVKQTYDIKDNEILTGIKIFGAFDDFIDVKLIEGYSIMLFSNLDVFLEI